MRWKQIQHGDLRIWYSLHGVWEISYLIAPTWKHVSHDYQLIGSILGKYYFRLFEIQIKHRKGGKIIRFKWLKAINSM